MERIRIEQRPDWRAKAEEYGFTFHTADGAAYWDETVAWRFSLREIEDDIEAPTLELEQMCLHLVGEVMGRDEQLERLAIPRAHWPLVRESWKRGDRNLYGRFDLAYDGTGPAKLLEYNADTPTSLFEAAVFQWTWLGTDGGGPPATGVGSVQLAARAVGGGHAVNPRRAVLYASPCAPIGQPGDRATTAYLADCARQAGLETIEMTIEEIGVNREGLLTDPRNMLIHTLFKLYPWEWLFREEFSIHLGKAQTQFIEPPWKALLSSKALLPLLWELAPNHPNSCPPISRMIRARSRWLITC